MCYNKKITPNRSVRSWLGVYWRRRIIACVRFLDYHSVYHIYAFRHDSHNSTVFFRSSENSRSENSRSRCIEESAHDLLHIVVYCKAGFLLHGRENFCKFIVEFPGNFSKKAREFHAVRVSHFSSLVFGRGKRRSCRFLAVSKITLLALLSQVYGEFSVNPQTPLNRHSESRPRRDEESYIISLD